MSSGFTLGALDRTNNTEFRNPGMNLSSKQNDFNPQSNGENKENEGRKKRFQKKPNNRKVTDESFPQHMMKSNESSNQIHVNQEDAEDNSQNSQLFCKASKKIRKQTIDRLKKRIEKQHPEHVKQNMMKHKHMNKRNGMRNYAPGKGIKTNN